MQGRTHSLLNADAVERNNMGGGVPQQKESSTGRHRTRKFIKPGSVGILKRPRPVLIVSKNGWNNYLDKGENIFIRLETAKTHRVDDY